MARFISPEELEQFKRLCSYSLTLENIADWFMIPFTTFNRILKRQPDLVEIYKKGKEDRKAWVEKSLYKKIEQGDRACIMFYLKCQGGWRETQRLEHTGGPEPIKVENTVNIESLDLPLETKKVILEAIKKQKTKAKEKEKKAKK